MDLEYLTTILSIALILIGGYIILYAFDRLACNNDGCGPNALFILTGSITIIIGFLLFKYKYVIRHK